MAKRIVILGAAGKDFHVFNTCYRHDGDIEVVAFTATQIPNIAGRRYPTALAGPRYPEGIRIVPEADLAALIAAERIDEAVFAYSDVPYEPYIAERRRVVEDAGARFIFPDVRRTMLKSARPVVAVCAVRTGAGKSQTTRKAARILREAGRRIVVVRHPMPYGDLAEQAVQRFASTADFEKHRCTIEEIEEYELHVQEGSVVYAGVDYEAILARAEQEADVILWDGGNNDTPFFAPTVWLCVADPLRPGDERAYYPGDVNFREADVLVLNKLDAATPEGVETVLAHAREDNPNATIIRANSAIDLPNPEALQGRRVLVIEDGPTTTHGGLRTGAGTIAATRAGAAELIDPRPFLVGTLKETFAKYPDIGHLLPAMGYSAQQIRDLEATVNAAHPEIVVIGTPIDLGRLIKIEAPHVRARYELQEIGSPALAEVLAPVLQGQAS